MSEMRTDAPNRLPKGREARSGIEKGCREIELEGVAGAGEIHDYPDTEPAASMVQRESVKKIERDKLKSGYRY